ncbi:MAG TPA: hypothetical protein ENH80_02050 [Phycisphaerae bacterium]|nr:hypothetical protein [Phycisphaerae bacterium]HDZ42700.1 hypothetical protein [Phycisphaerae bacterium]
MSMQKKTSAFLVIGLCLAVTIWPWGLPRKTFGQEVEAGSAREDASGAPSIEKLGQRDIAALRKIKTVKLIVKQEYFNEKTKLASAKNVLSEKTISEILGHAGVKVVGAGVETYDSVIEISAVGRTKGTKYGRRMGIRYSGASVSGQLVVMIADRPVLAERFAGRKNPDVVLTDLVVTVEGKPGQSSKTYGTPEQAPFSEAYWASGSLLPAMCELIGKVYGPDCLIKALNASKRTSTAELKAIENAIVKLGRPASEPIEKALEDAKQENKETLVKALFRMDPSSAGGPLVALLARDERLPVKLEAITILGKLNDLSAVGPLTAILTSDADKRLKAKAADALGQIGAGAGAVDPLMTLLGNADVDVGLRSKAARALGKLGDAQAVPPLIEITTNRKESWLLRRDAISALGQIGHPSAVGPLIDVIKASGKNPLLVRHEAIEALTKLRDKQVAPALMDLLNDQHASIRAGAAKALGVIGHWRALPALKLLATQDPDKKVREQATKAEGEIRKTRGNAPGSPRPTIESTKTPAEEAAYRIRMAKAYAAGGKKKKARELLRSVIQDFPDTPAAEKAEKRLAELDE